MSMKSTSFSRKVRNYHKNNNNNKYSRKDNINGHLTEKIQAPVPINAVFLHKITGTKFCT